MCASFLIFLFGIIVYSSTTGADPIFRVEMFFTIYQSLDTTKVINECSMKMEILSQITSTITATEQDNWFKYFKKLIQADQQIVKSLNIHLSYIIKNIYKNVAGLYYNGLIPAASWTTIQTELQNYLQFLDGLDFANMLWNRSFLGNPFENILKKLNPQRIGSFNAKQLKTIFKDAYQTVETAKEQIARIIGNLKEDLEDQRVKTRNVVLVLDDLNDDLLLFQMNMAKSAKQVQKLINTLKTVSDAVQNFKKPKMLLGCFGPTTSWKVQLMKELENIENAHKLLNNAIETL